MHGELRAVHRRLPGGVRLARIRADAHDGKAAGPDRGETVLQADRAVVGCMVVGHGGYVDAGVAQRGERRGRRAEMEVLRSWVASGRDRRLEVDHRQVGSRQLRFRLAERRGRVRCEPGRGALLEVDVTGEREAELARRGRFDRCRGRGGAGVADAAWAVGCGGPLPVACEAVAEQALTRVIDTAVPTSQAARAAICKWGSARHGTSMRHVQ